MSSSSSSPEDQSNNNTPPAGAIAEVPPSEDAALQGGPNPDEEKIKNSLVVLKEYAKDISRSPDQVAVVLGISPNIVNQVMRDFAAMFAAVRTDADYPQRLLDIYRTNRSRLTVLEFKSLTNLIGPIVQNIDRLMKQAGQPGVEAIAMSVNNQQQPPGGMGPGSMMPPGMNPGMMQQPNMMGMADPAMYGQQQQSGGYPQPDMSTNAGLLKSILLNMTREHPTRIENFIIGFKQAEGDLIANPTLLKNLLHMNFGPMLAENVTAFFNMMRPKYVFGAAESANAGMGGMGPMMGPGAGNQSPFAFGQGGAGGMGMMGGMMPPSLPPGMPPGMAQWYMQQWFDMMKEAEADKRAERAAKMQAQQLQQYTSMLMSTMMARMMEAQTPTNPNMMAGMNQMGQAQAMEEVIDPSTGKVVGRKFIPTTIWGPGQYPGAHQSGNNTDAALIKMLSEERNILLTKVVNGNGGGGTGDINATLLNGIMQMTQQRMDPFGMLKAARESMPEVFGHREPVNLDTLRAKWDSDMQMLTAKMKFKEMEHQWEREDREKVMADKNMDRLMGGLGQLGNQILGPAINTAVQTWAMNSARARAGAAPGGPQGPMPSAAVAPQQQQQMMQTPQPPQPQMMMPAMMSPQQPDPMAGYQQISPEVLTDQKRQTLQSYTDEQLDALAKDRDKAAWELQADGALVDEERVRRKRMQEARAQPQVVGQAQYGGFDVPTPPNTNGP